MIEEEGKETSLLGFDDDGFLLLHSLLFSISQKLKIDIEKLVKMPFNRHANGIFRQINFFLYVVKEEEKYNKKMEKELAKRKKNKK